MASRFVLPVADVGNGISPADGAKLEFFISGTSTQKDTFSDNALTIPNANPVIADGDGVFPDIFLSQDVDYKVTLKDKNDVQIGFREADPVVGGVSVSDFAKTYLDDLTASETRTTLDAMGRVASGVTDNLVTLDSSDDAKDSGVSFERLILSANAGGTVDAITATFSPAITALTDQRLVSVRASGANTTGPTFSPNGLAAKDIVKNGNKALAASDIPGADFEMLLLFNSTNDKWELLNPFDISVFDADNFMQVQDRKPSGTDGGTFTSGSFVTRTLDTVITNKITGASVSSNQITLPAGTYYLEATAPARQCDQHKIKIRNITGGADALIGSSAQAASASATQTDSFVSGLVTIPASRAFEVQHRCNTTRATDGLGTASSFSVVEVYTDIKIWKVG